MLQQLFLDSAHHKIASLLKCHWPSCHYWSLLRFKRLMPVKCFVEKYTYSSENNKASFIEYRLRKENIYFIKYFTKFNWIKYTLVVRTLQVLTINCTYLAKCNSKVNIVFVLENKVCCAVLVPFYNNSWFKSDTLKNPGSNSWVRVQASRRQNGGNQLIISIKIRSPVVDSSSKPVKSRRIIKLPTLTTWLSWT